MLGIQSHRSRRRSKSRVLIDIPLCRQLDIEAAMRESGPSSHPNGKIGLARQCDQFHYIARKILRILAFKPPPKLAARNDLHRPLDVGDQYRQPCRNAFDDRQAEPFVARRLYQQVVLGERIVDELPRGSAQESTTSIDPTIDGQLLQI